MSSVKQVKWLELPSVVDERGILTSIESHLTTPFEIKRIFYMHHVTADRGGHSHMDTDQVIVAISGNFMIKLNDGKDSMSFRMDDPQKGLFIPKMIFIELTDFSKDAVCLVLASTHYDIRKSLRNFDDYIKVINS